MSFNCSVSVIKVFAIHSVTFINKIIIITIILKFILFISQIQITMSQETCHDATCQGSCVLCSKQKQINQLKKINNNISLHSIYQNDFHKRKQKTHKKQKRHSHPVLSPTNMTYIDIQSTYLNQFHNKKLQTSRFHPKDCITKPDSHLPISTTYLKSYHSNQTIEVQKPIKSIQMPLGALPFNAKSNYRKSFSPHDKIKVNLPIIQKDATMKPVGIGQFQTTNMKSFRKNNNPQISSRPQIIKPTNNLGNLSSFANNFQTTYKNMFLSVGKHKTVKHDIDDIGNANKNRRGKKNM